MKPKLIAALMVITFVPFGYFIVLGWMWRKYASDKAFAAKS